MTDRGILAIDLGTTNCKAAVFVEGAVVRIASARIETFSPAPQHMEQEPGTWRAALTAMVGDLIGDTHITAVGLSAQSDTLVLVDETGEAVQPAMLWMDPRGADEAAAIEQRWGIDGLHSRTGLRAAANFTAPKAGWVARHEPRALAAARWIMQPKDYLFQWLTGEALTDPSSATRTLAYDVRSDAWSDEIIAALQIPVHMFPPVARDSTESRPLSTAAARSLGLPVGIPVAVGAADRAAEALGLAADASRAMLSSGTATGLAVPVPIGSIGTDSRLVTPRHAIATENLVLASIPTTGVVLDWLAGLGQVPSAAASRRMLRDAEQTAPDPRGVIASPAFAGSRSIRWEPDDRGQFVGLSLTTTRGHLARAVIESIGLELRAILAVMAAARLPIHELVLTGGLHRNAFVCQVMSDVTGLDAVRYPERDAALAGAMLLAVAETERAGDLRVVARARLGRPRRFTADSALAPVYSELAERYERILADRGDSRASTSG